MLRIHVDVYFLSVCLCVHVYVFGVYRKSQENLLSMAIMNGIYFHLNSVGLCMDESNSSTCYHI